MPELPEVEIIVRGLRETVVGRTIVRVHVNAPPRSIFVSDSFARTKFNRILEERTILNVNRRGKNILIGLSGDVTLWAHLKMTGHFFYLPGSEPVGKHDLVVFDFHSIIGGKDGNALQLRFNDYRRFGRLRLFYNNELWDQEGLRNIGPEPLKVTADDFIALCRGRHRMIKPALLDQTFIAGLGNIYADESLHYARIHPRRLISSISRRKLTELHRHIQILLRKSIRLMGTSVDSFAGIYGQPGSFQKYLIVYKNEGNPCRFCGSRIVREKIGSRSAHYCPRCQRIR
ncbi:MAG: bifunctional DNA-formamidopyrimidine glycosylase/DNA-(apurinic or apyrimidinic site) lyase [candidate division Zixibacteria bacterium]|nr:bifunctional DNA-formamidopyrimidine glycosylase/DNA-(apurinic or apyrimidinic site) lyase [candidate division Zixibacteria bacterium]